MSAIMLNALTIDVEDYYHVAAFDSVVRFADWERYESRVEKNTQRILDLLDEHATQATFFVLGWVLERHPGLIRTIVARGHEVASHGYAHQRIYTQTPAQFRAETRRSKSLLEDTLGQPIRGYRAASYSITRQSLWALDVLREAGFVYDSSIFPIRHDLYGIPSHPRFCSVIPGEHGAPLVEFPLSTLRLGGTNFPIAGGGYLRLFPYAYTRWGIRYLNTREGQPAVVYLHPWELDPAQPRLPAGRLSRFRHYTNLHRMEERLVRLLQDFSFGTMSEVLHSRGFLNAAGQAA
ncbi:MAG TPA: XrtA system polysaccharide deacetylase [Candidatus Tectomicrobia bacterium]